MAFFGRFRAGVRHKKHHLPVQMTQNHHDCDEYWSLLSNDWQLGMKTVFDDLNPLIVWKSLTHVPATITPAGGRLASSDLRTRRAGSFDGCAPFFLNEKTSSWELYMNPSGRAWECRISSCEDSPIPRRKSFCIKKWNDVI